jgi:hypothetical protein
MEVNIMTKQEYTERLQAIGTEADETQRRELIAQLIDDGGADYDSFESTSAERDQLRSANETLREANMQLFLRVGSKSEPDQKPGDPPKEKPKFEDLFNEKGGIK